LKQTEQRRDELAAQVKKLQNELSHQTHVRRVSIMSDNIQTLKQQLNDSRHEVAELKDQLLNQSNASINNSHDGVNGSAAASNGDEFLARVAFRLSELYSMLSDEVRDGSPVDIDVDLLRNGGADIHRITRALDQLVGCVGKELLMWNAMIEQHELLTRQHESEKASYENEVSAFTAQCVRLELQLHECKNESDQLRLQVRKLEGALALSTDADASTTTYPINPFAHSIRR